VKDLQPQDASHVQFGSLIELQSQNDLGFGWSLFDTDTRDGTYQIAFFGGERTPRMVVSFHAAQAG
jgi:hypothetical protein